MPGSKDLHERSPKPIQSLSVVATLFRSAPHIREFYDRVTAASAALTDDLEIVFVNDGSPDESLDLAVALHKADPRVTVVDLSRNFGHHRAMMIGLNYARGDLVFLIDVDLEEPPELLVDFHAQMVATGSDVVYGVQAQRRGSRFERLSGDAYYRIVNALCDVRLPRNLVTARLMTNRYVRALVQHREREIIISGLWQATGFKQIPFTMNKGTRATKSSYSVLRRLDIFLDHIINYSSRLPHYLLFAGLSIFLVSLASMTALIVRHLFFGHALAGWTSLIVSLWLLGGLQLLFIGIVGSYAARTFLETKKRPYAIVRQLHRATLPPAGDAARREEAPVPVERSPAKAQ